MRRSLAASSLALALAAAACDSGGGPGPGEAPAAAGTPAERGEALFRKKAGGLSCLDCHSTTAEDQPDPARRRVGHSLVDATRRPSWWYGAVDEAKGGTAGEAVLTCVARFQQRSWNTALPVLPDGGKDLSKVEIAKDEVAALVAYLDTLARPGPHPLLPAKKGNSREALARAEALTGDVDRGRKVYASTCALCHGTGGRNNLAPPLKGDTSPDGFRVIDYVRSGPSKAERQASDTWMPFFTPDALPDQDLADVAALADGKKW